MQLKASYLHLCRFLAELEVGVLSESVTAGGLAVSVWLAGAGTANVLRLTGVGRAEGRRALTCGALQAPAEGVRGPADGF